MSTERKHENDQINIDDFKPRKTLYKLILKKHGISIGTIANYLGLSYPYVCSMLNGSFRMTKKAERKLQKLIDQLEAV